MVTQFQDPLMDSYFLEVIDWLCLNAHEDDFHGVNKFSYVRPICYHVTVSHLARTDGMDTVSHV